MYMCVCVCVCVCVHLSYLSLTVHSLTLPRRQQTAQIKTIQKDNKDLKIT